MDIPSASPIINSLRRATSPTPLPIPSASFNAPCAIYTIADYFSSSESDEYQSPTPQQNNKRRLQQVSTKRTRKIVVKWMLQEIEACCSDKFIASKTVKKYPEHFRGTEKASLGKASRWFKQREEILSISDDEVMRVSHFVKRKRLANGSPSVQRKEILVKAGKEIGRKRSVWATEVHRILVVQFERLSKTGLKSNANILKTLARRILLHDHKEFELILPFSRNERMGLSSKITKRSLQSFMERFNIVARKQCGKLMISHVKQEQMEREVAFHLGVVYRAFCNEELDEDMVENVDETHFVVNMDNGRNLSFVVRLSMLTCSLEGGNDNDGADYRW